MKLREKANAAAASAVHRNDGLRGKLNITPGPDDAGIDRARRPMLAAVERRRKREFDDWDQLVERLAPTGALHVRLQVRNAVFDREAPLQRVGVPLDVDVARIVDRRRARA